MDQQASAACISFYPRARIQGYDLARGIAIFMMVLINVKLVFSPYDSEPLWACRIMDFLDRRAAAVLVMLAGVGLTLLMGKNGFKTGSRILMKRAVFLMIAGTLLSREWEADILHFYGVFIGIGIVLSSFSSRNLLAAAILFLLPGLARHNVAIEQSLGVLDPVSFTGRLADLLLTGYYPVFPWAALFIAGMWIGRQDLKKPGLTVKLLFWGFLMTITSEGISSAACRIAEGLAQNAVDGQNRIADFFHILTCFADTNLAAPTSFSMISGVGTGLMVIMACMLLSSTPQGFGMSHLNAAGKTTLTLYVSHILGMNSIEAVLGIDTAFSVLPVLFSATVFFAVYMAAARLWLIRYSNGPLESMMREFPYLRYPPDKQAFTHANRA